MAAAVQFARFASVCRTYRAALPPGDARARSRARSPARTSAAPSTSLMATSPPPGIIISTITINGRPFVLIGHSQGTIHLTRLLAARDRERPGGGADAFGAADRLCGRGARGPAGRRQPAAHAALHPRRPDRLRRHLYVVPRRQPAAARRPARPRHPCRHDRGLHQSRGARRRQRAARFLLVRGPDQFGGPVITWSSTGPPPAPFLHTRAASSRANAGTTARPAISRSPSMPIPPTPAPTRFPATSISGRSSCPAGASTSATPLRDGRSHPRGRGPARRLAQRSSSQA